jgi:hypothetical protein
VLHAYSITEVRLFFEKIVLEENAARADFIEGVALGAAVICGGSKELTPILEGLRGKRGRHGRA